MPSLSEEVDAVVGGDTHRDTHALEMTTAAGVRISTLAISNDDAGFAEALAWIAEHGPGPRVIVGLEGTRSYGIGLARVVAAAGLIVLEMEHPRRADQRRGKSNPIDAHLGALQVLRTSTDRKALPRSDGAREGLRILLSARREMSTVRTQQINRLRALLLTGDEQDRQAARGTMTDVHLQPIIRRRSRTGESTEQAIRRSEARRLATAIRLATTELKQNKTQLTELVGALAPALLNKVGVGPVSAAQAIVSSSHVGRCRKRCRVRGVGRRQPAASQQRPHRPAPPQPRRRSATQPGIT